MRKPDADIYLPPAFCDLARDVVVAHDLRPHLGELVDAGYSLLELPPLRVAPNGPTQVVVEPETVLHRRDRVYHLARAIATRLQLEE